MVPEGYYPAVLTEHFAWQEAEATTHREIDNTIPVTLFKVIRNTAQGMERIRSALAAPIHISSWYRCHELNEAVGGSKESQHTRGEAVDWICPRYGSPVLVVKKLLQFQEYLDFDQLILEHTWIHTSFQSDPARKNRGEVLSLLKRPDPKTGKRYASGLTDPMGNPYYA